MEVIGINLRPDSSQIIAGSLHKDVLQVKQIEALAPVLIEVLNGDIEAIAEFFTMATKAIKKKHADIYLGLPDDVVKIDCAERDTVDEEHWAAVIHPWVAQLLQVNQDDYYIKTPLVLPKRNGRINITGAAMQKRLVDNLLQAAELAKVNLISIEPATFGLLRFINNWETEHCILEVWERRSSITGYSPIKGMFKIGLPSFGWRNVLEFNDGAEQLAQNIVLHDYTAYQTYGLANTNIPIYIVSQRQEITSHLINSSLADRIHSLTVPDKLIKSKRYDQDELNAYGTPLGLAFYPIFERMADSESKLYTY